MFQRGHSYGSEIYPLLFHLKMLVHVICNCFLQDKRRVSFGRLIVPRYLKHTMHITINQVSQKYWHIPFYSKFLYVNLRVYGWVLDWKK